MNVDIICVGCLSTDRKLYSLSGFYQILNEFRLFQKPTKHSICWECKAKLKNMDSFIKQVKYVQSILEGIPVYGVPNLPRLSHLSIVKNDVILSYYSKDCDITKNDEALIKVEQFDNDDRYKYENDHFDGDYNDDLKDNCENDLDFTLVQDIKLEGIKTDVSQITKSKKLKAKKKLRKLKIKRKYDNSRHILKRIQENDLSFWLERESNSDFYKKYKHSCMHCFKIFRDAKPFAKHMSNIHKTTKFICNICTAGFNTKQDLKYHVLKHYFIRECTICQFKCYGKPNMRSHMRKHKLSKEYKCDQCNQSFSLIIDLKQHYKLLHGQCICNECGKSVRSKILMEKHLKNHHTVITCKECNTTYKNKKNYNAHFNLRHVKYPPDVQEMCYCVQCDIKFDNNALYKRHLNSSKAHKGSLEERKKIPCSECDKVFTRKTFMMNHYRLIHLNKTNFYCKLCDKYLLNSTRYNYHMDYQHQKLEKVKNKLCSICGRGFNTNRTLANHILTHTGERPFPCDICGARFSQKHAMQSHVKHVHFNISRRKVR